MLIDIRNSEDIATLRRGIDGGRVIGLTSGCYDLFHNLHLTYLQRCRRMCDFLIVGVDSDDLVRNTKGPERPIIPEHHRVNLVSALRCVDAAFIMGSLKDFELAVDGLKPKFIFKNQNFRPQDVIGVDAAEIVTVPDVFQPDSTSGIIEEIKRAKNKADAQPRKAPGIEPSTPSATPTSAALLRASAARGSRRGPGNAHKEGLKRLAQLNAESERAAQAQRANNRRR